MKKSLFLIMASVCVQLSAQNISDVLRYNDNSIQGTARFQAMGGAFGALGGDMSAMHVNPAGGAVFNNSLFTITGTVFNRDNDVNYGGGFNNRTLNSPELNQLGGVFVFKNVGSSSDWQKFSFSFNYDMVQNFDNEFFASGTTSESIADYFLAFAQGIPFGNLLIQDGEFIEEAYLDIGSTQGFGAQQAFLGYYGGLIDPEDDSDPDSSTYFANGQYNTVSQEFLQSTAGYNSRFTVNLAGQYKENLYLGAALHFNTIFYDKLTFFDESGYNAGSPIQFATFDNLLHTEGSGFSFSLGAIARLNENVRLGGSYQSPTWYRLTDDTSQRINSDLADSDIDFINFNVINLFERYTIKTPGKITGSLAIVFGRDGLISLDYGYQDMTEAELRPASDSQFAQVNNEITDTLGAVTTINVGGEYRIDQVSLRGGYRFIESPFEDGSTIGELNGYSGGLGYDFGGSRLDLTFSRTEQEVDQQLFDVGVTTPATVNAVRNNISLGFTMNF